jgi:hypothetical protein
MKDTVLDLLREYVLHPDVSIGKVIDRDDEVTVYTDSGLYTARYDTSSWIGREPTRIAREPFVDRYLVIHDESTEHPETWPVYGFLLLTGGAVVFLNDADEVAELGRRLRTDLSADAYAEVLARFHGPRKGYLGHRVVEGPEVIEADPYTIGFTSNDHPRDVDGEWVVDVCRWTVTVPEGEPARWSVRTVHKDLPRATPT